MAPILLGKRELFQWISSISQYRVSQYDELSNGYAVLKTLSIVFPKINNSNVQNKLSRKPRLDWEINSLWNSVQFACDVLKFPLDVVGMRAGKFKPCFSGLVALFFSHAMATSTDLCFDFAHPIDPRVVAFIKSPNLAISLQIGSASIKEQPLNEKKEDDTFSESLFTKSDTGDRLTLSDLYIDKNKPFRSLSQSRSASHLDAPLIMKSSMLSKSVHSASTSSLQKSIASAELIMPPNFEPSSYLAIDTSTNNDIFESANFDINTLLTVDKSKLVWPENFKTNGPEYVEALVSQVELLKASLHRAHENQISTENSYKSEIERIRLQNLEEVKLLKEDFALHEQLLTSKQNLQMDILSENYISRLHSIQVKSKDCSKCSILQSELDIRANQLTDLKKQMEIVKTENSDLRQRYSENVSRWRNIILHELPVSIGVEQLEKILAEKRENNNGNDLSIENCIATFKQLLCQSEKESKVRETVLLNEIEGLSLQVAELESKPLLNYVQISVKLKKAEAVIQQLTDSAKFLRLKNKLLEDKVSSANINEVESLFHESELDCTENEMESRDAALLNMIFSLSSDSNNSNLKSTIEHIKSGFLEILKEIQNWKLNALRIQAIAKKQKDEIVKLQENYSDTVHKLQSQEANNRNNIMNMKYSYEIHSAKDLAALSVTCETLSMKNKELLAEKVTTLAAINQLKNQISSMNEHTFESMRKYICQYVERAQTMKLYCNKNLQFMDAFSSLYDCFHIIFSLIEGNPEKFQDFQTIFNNLISKTWRSKFFKLHAEVVAYHNDPIISELQTTIEGSFAVNASSIFPGISRLPKEFLDFVQTYASSCDEYAQSIKRDLFESREQCVALDEKVSILSESETRWKIISTELKQQVAKHIQHEEVMQTEIYELLEQLNSQKS